jgi:hypothetical protein
MCFSANFKRNRVKIKQYTLFMVKLVVTVTPDKILYKKLLKGIGTRSVESQPPFSSKVAK